MSNTKASEDNVKSPSTYGNKGYEENRKKEKRKNKINPEKEGLKTVISYSKYAVGGESKAVPASAELDEKDKFIHRREQNQPKKKDKKSNGTIVNLNKHDG